MCFSSAAHWLDQEVLSLSNPEANSAPLTTAIAASHASDQNYEAFWDSELPSLQYLAWCSVLLKNVWCLPGESKHLNLQHRVMSWLLTKGEGWIWMSGLEEGRALWAFLIREETWNTRLQEKSKHTRAAPSVRHKLLSLLHVPFPGDLWGVGKMQMLGLCQCWGSLGSQTNPKVSVLREPTVPMLGDPSLWCLPGCDRLCEDFTPGKTCLHLHCFGIFGTRQENKGQSHLRSWSPTSKIQNYLSQVPRPINSARITTAVCRMKHCPPKFCRKLDFSERDQTPPWEQNRALGESRMKPKSQVFVAIKVL